MGHSFNDISSCATRCNSFHILSTCPSLTDKALTAQGDGAPLDVTEPELINSSLHTPCDSPKVRQAALELLKDVMS
eukprot:scaffold411573_cov35-Prasinocladus_malaysianus.AAC.2